MFIVFDLDGTLSDETHRAHLREAGDWAGYYQACDQDAPINSTMTIFNQVLFYCYRVLQGDNHRVQIWTGREITVGLQTRNWLFEYSVPYRYYCDRVYIAMRPKGDYRPATELKQEFMDTHGKPDLVFEDQPYMVDFWTNAGVDCLLLHRGKENK